MTFQICFLPKGIPEAVHLAKLCEELGYDLIWIPDQSFHHDPYILLSAIAQATQDIRIGLGVTTPYSRHPVQIARAIASLDELSGGRVVLGLGAGNKRMFLDKLGIPQKRAAALVRQSVEVIRKLLAGETVDWESPELTVKSVMLEFPTRAEVPIYIASRSPLMLSVGGQVADGIIAEALFTTGGIQYGREQIQKGAGEAGRDWKSVEHICWQVMDCTEDRESGIEALRPWAAHIIGASRPEILSRLGIDPERGYAIQSAYREGGVEGAVEHVSEEDVDAIAVVGDGMHCIRFVERLRDEGVSSIAFLVRGSEADKERSLRSFAKAVIRERA
jgi:5,10-methylenetetrahydromethanopterin reductase